MNEADLKTWIEAGFQGVREEMGAQIGSLREEMGAQIGSLREEMGGQIVSLREEMGGQIGSLREEMGGQIVAMGGPLGSLREEMGGQIGSLREEMGGQIVAMGGQLGSLREEFGEFRVEVNRRFDVLKVDIDKAHIKFEQVLHTLQFVNEGESPVLAQRVSALEYRVTNLETKRRK